MTNLETIEAKPREIVFKQYVKKHARDIEQNPFWHQPNQWYRWLVKLECECITEVLTRGDETPPTEWDYDTRRLLGEEPIYKQTWVGHPGGQHMCILGDKYDYLNLVNKTRSLAAAANRLAIYGARSMTRNVRGRKSRNGSLVKRSSKWNLVGLFNSGLSSFLAATAAPFPRK